MIVPQAQLLAIGNELVSGRRAETNGERISRWLESLGCELVVRALVADRAALIAQAIRQALQSGPDLIVITGGLGPTVDDVTRDGLALALDLPLELDEQALKTIENRYRERGRAVPSGAARMAQRPRGAEWIANPIGTAPGIHLRHGQTELMVLPGVPRELDEMLERDVLPRLRRTLAAGFVIRSRVVRIAALPESEIDQRVASISLSELGVQISHLAKPGDVELMLTARGRSDAEADDTLDAAVSALRAVLGDHIYAIGSGSQAGVICDLLVQRDWTMATAESVTGGLVAQRISDQPGASRAFRGGTVAYTDEAKRRALGVAASVLDSYGAASSEVAAAMAEAIRDRLQVDAVVATTGIAGPGGGSTEKPVGLAYIAVITPQQLRLTRHLFAGDRRRIRIWITAMALEQLRRAMLDLAPLGDVIEWPVPSRGAS